MKLLSCGQTDCCNCPVLCACPALTPSFIHASISRPQPQPFNPILGETYQARYPNGVEVFCEQISHHPPVSSWQVVEPSGKVRHSMPVNDEHINMLHLGCVRGSAQRPSWVTGRDAVDWSQRVPSDLRSLHTLGPIP